MPSRAKTQGARVGTTYQLVTVDDLSGGTDLRRTPSLMAPARARTIRNFSLSEPGVIKVAYGYTQFSTTSLGTSRPQGGQRVYTSSNIFTLVAYGGQIYKPTDAGVWGSTVCSTRSASNQIYFPHDRDLVAIFDGENRPLKSTNGSSWTLMGIDAPTSGATVSSASSGNLLGSNEYELTWSWDNLSLGHASDESSAVSTYTMGSTGSLNLVVPNSTDTQVDQITVYARNKTAGEEVRRRATVAAPSAGANSTINVASSGWGSNAEAPTTHGVPLAWAFGVSWKNRWWARHPTIKNRIHFTEIYLPQAWYSLYYIDIPFARGDEITAIVPQGDTLVVFGVTGSYLIIGQTSLDFEVKPSLGEAGCVGTRAAVALESGVVHAAYQGVYIFDGATDRLLTYDIDPGWRDLMSNASPALIALIAVEYHQLRKELRISVPRLYPTGTWGEWILDLNRTRLEEEPAWTTTDRVIGGYIHWNGNESATGNQGRLFSWGSTNGWLMEESKGTAANSSNMTATYEGPTLTTGRHKARWVDTYLEHRQAAGTLTAELSVDGVGQGGQDVDIGSQLAMYGDSTFTYGDSTRLYGGVDRSMTPLNQPLTAEGYTAKLTLTYVGMDEYKHYTYAHGIKPEPVPRGI